MDGVLHIGGPYDGDRMPDLPMEEVSMSSGEVRTFGSDDGGYAPPVTYLRREVTGWSESVVFVMTGIEVTDELLSRYLSRTTK